MEEYVLYKTLDKKTKATLHWTGPYKVSNIKGDWYELTPIASNEAPFFAHARQLKRYQEDPNVSTKEVAYRDDMGPYSSILAVKNPNRTNSTMNNVLVGVTYEKYPNSEYWLPIEKMLTERLFIEHCLQHGYYSWITNEARRIHADFINNYVRTR